MVKTYKCGICDHISEQKSHHEQHIKTTKHIQKREIKSLKMMQEPCRCKGENGKIIKLKGEEKEKHIKKLLDKKETIIIDVEESVECQKYKPSNKVVWELSENVDENKLYLEEFKKIQSVIDKVHQFMFNTNQINGITAMRDMMKILPFILLKSYFNSSDFKDIASSVNLSNNKLPKYLTYAGDITKILNEENPLNNWRLFIKQLISKVLPEVFTEGDGEFEFNKKGTGEKTFKYIVRTFNDIDVSEEFIEAFSTACGDIHELFRQYAGGKEAKDFGGFNTPRHALNMIYQFPPIKELIEEKIKEEGCSIYDPTMGTGGFLTRFYKTFDISSDNIYGCELSPDTIKFAFVSLFMTTKKILKNCESCNSLTETNNLHKQETIGLANPPFGTSIKYKTWKKNGETFDGELETYEKKYPDNSVKFKDIYPIETNNGACLFTQHFVYKIKENGLGIIILPDGELFEGNSKWSKTFREWLLTNVNLKMIIKMPQGTFEHAGVKTNVLVFTKNGKTENIQYFDTTKECNVVKELFTITEEDFKSTNYSLDMSDYLVEEEINFEVPMVKLSDVCEMVNGYGFSSSEYIENGNPIISIKNIDQNGNINLNRLKTIKQNEKFEKHIINDYDILIALTGATIGKVGKFINPDDKTYYLNQRVGKIVNIKDKKILYDYLYLYLQSDLFQNKVKLECCDSDRNNISTNTILDFKIPLPSLEIQEKIVEELSMIETNIKSIETRIKQLKEEKERFKKYSRKSEIKELLKDADIKKLGEVCEISQGSSIKSDKKIKGDIPYYGSNGIIDYYNYKLYEGEYIITGRVGTLGTYYYVNGEFSLCDNAFYMKPKELLNIKYLYYHSLFVYSYNFETTNGPVPSFNRTKFNSFKIPVPTPEIQEQCIQIYQEKEKFLQSIDDKIEAEKKYIEELKQLSKDIIYSYC